MTTNNGKALLANKLELKKKIKERKNNHFIHILNLDITSLYTQNEKKNIENLTF